MTENFTHNRNKLMANDKLDGLNQSIVLDGTGKHSSDKMKMTNSNKVLKRVRDSVNDLAILKMDNYPPNLLLFSDSGLLFFNELYMNGRYIEYNIGVFTDGSIRLYWMQEWYDPKTMETYKQVWDHISVDELYFPMDICYECGKSVEDEMRVEDLNICGKCAEKEYQQELRDVYNGYI